MTSEPLGDAPLSDDAASSMISAAATLAALAGAADKPSLLAALAPCVAPLSTDACALAVGRDGGASLELLGVVERGGAIRTAGPGVRLRRTIHPDADPRPDVPFVSEDVANEADLTEDTRRVLLEELRLGAIAAFPLIHDGAVVGSFAAGYRRPRAFAAGELPVLQAIAGVVAVALAHIEDRETLARKVQQVHGLYRAGEMLTALGEEDVLLQRAAELLVSELRYVSCWTAMLSPSGDTLRAAAAAGGAGASRIREVSLEDRERPVVEAFHRGTPTWFGDIQALADRQGWGASVRRAGFRSIVAVPLRAAEQTLGVLCIGSLATRAGEDELSLLAAFGNQIAASIVRVRMDREREQHFARLEEATERQARLLEVVRQLSTPVIPVHDGVLVLPLIGTIDTARSVQIMDSLLTAVQRQGAAVVIVDVTGVPVVDTAVANHLLQAIRAVALLGARTVVVGISPQVAQTIVALGIDLSAMVTRGDLRAGIAYALRLLQRSTRPAAAR